METVRAVEHLSFMVFAKNQSCTCECRKLTLNGSWTALNEPGDLPHEEWDLRLVVQSGKNSPPRLAEKEISNRTSCRTHNEYDCTQYEYGTPKNQLVSPAEVGVDKEDARFLYIAGALVKPANISRRGVSMPPITVERERLYEEAWAEPMSSLAKRYHVSDVALAKVCRKLGVPVPPRGYWARIRNGYRVTKPPLPKLDSGKQTSTTVSPYEAKSRDVPEAVKEQHVYEAAPENRISEAYFSRKLHPLVQTTKQILAGRMEPSGKIVALNVRVSKSSRDRALRILSALFYACEERGFSVTAKERRESLILIKGEEVAFLLEEPSRRITIPESKRQSSWSPTFELEPTGKLIFRIQEYVDIPRKNWYDGAKQKLEDQLNDVIAGLVEASLAVREKRIEREKQEIIRAEQERERLLYADRRRQLESDVKQLQEASRLRELAGYVQKQFLDEENQDLIHRWSDWVNRIANDIDPTRDGSEPFFKRYKIE